MEKTALMRQLRRSRLRLLRTYVFHVGWFTSTCATAATDSSHIFVASSLWLALITVPPVLVCTYLVHKTIRLVEPDANSAGLKQIVVSLLLFSPFEAGLVLPAINLWISGRILRAWDRSVKAAAVEDARPAGSDLEIQSVRRRDIPPP